MMKPDKQYEQAVSDMRDAIAAMDKVQPHLLIRLNDEETHRIALLMQEMMEGVAINGDMPLTVAAATMMLATEVLRHLIDNVPQEDHSSVN